MLYMALGVIKRLDIAQENRSLSYAELALRRGLKRRVVGLAVIERSRKKQASTITNLRERFFHQKVHARRRKNSIQRLQHQGGRATTHEDKVSRIQDYFMAIMGRELETSIGKS
jgi:hypothetical protein